MSLTVKTDYVAEAQQLIRQAHRGKPKTQALIAGLMDVHQTAEYAIQTLLSPYDLMTATGDKLAQIGSIFGLSSYGLPDDSFRLLIQGAIAERHSDGTLPNILAVTKTLYQADRVAADSPLSAGSPRDQPGGFISLHIFEPQLPSPLFNLARRLVAACIPAGIALGEITISPVSNVLIFDSHESENQPDRGVFASLL